MPDLSGLIKQTGLSHFMTRLLYLRGRKTPREMEDFLHPLAAKRPDPFLLQDMDKAVTRIHEAIEGSETIRIIGDYDQDGIAATAILMIALQRLGASVDFRIPDRVQDGYGIAPKHVQEAKNDGIGLLLTCDNGVAAFEAAEAAYDQGIDLIVTDHHQLQETLPTTYALINPHRKEDKYPFKPLAGAGVALKLCEALWEKRKTADFPSILYGYAAMGTVCDVMDLVGENRMLVVKGLQVLNTRPSPGIRALQEEAKISGALDVYTLGFVVGPTINAAGRLGNAEDGVSLLLASDAIRAKQLAQQLRRLNVQRQELTETALEHVREQIPDPLPDILVLKTDCHESLLGIVAGKLRDAYYRPAIVLAASSEEEMLKGSGRSISSYNMIAHLQEVHDVLQQYGGHAMAAGLRLHTDDLERFRAKLSENWKPEENDLERNLRIDFPIDLRYVDPALAREIERLEPYGKGNPKPVFASNQVELAGVKVIGKNRNTLRFRFRRGSREYTGIQFRGAEETLKKMYTKFGRRFESAFQEQGEGLMVSIAYTPQMNEYAGARFLQLVIEDIR